MNKIDFHRYDEIIGLPHHVSSTHPHMAVSDRAAQFSPFAALTGYDDAIRETARLTEEKMELDEDRKNILNKKLLILQKHIKLQPEIKITFFKPDDKKSGGAYISISDKIKKIDTYGNSIVLTEGTKIPIQEILDIESECADLFGEL